MKEWKSPELTVLVRSNSEEMVLVGCKNLAVRGSDTEVSICGLNAESCGSACNIAGNS